mgnify:CR=1 FL=1
MILIESLVQSGIPFNKLATSNWGIGVLPLTVNDLLSVAIQPLLEVTCKETV